MACIASLLSNVFQAPTVATPAIAPQSTPYGNNPFVNYSSRNYTNNYYAQNRPVKGGYFAGYYNGKQNIVGRKLFIEV